MSSSGVRVVERWYEDYPTENSVIPTGPTLIASTSASAGYVVWTAEEDQDRDVSSLLRRGWSHGEEYHGMPGRGHDAA
jgi:hypothetical protein